MRGLVVVAAILVIALTVYFVVRAIRRTKAQDRLDASWTVEQWTRHGNTHIGVRRRPEPDRLTDQVVVATIPDDDPEWLNKRAKAWEEATQRATELNGNRPA